MLTPLKTSGATAVLSVSSAATEEQTSDLQNIKRPSPLPEHL